MQAIDRSVFAALLASLLLSGCAVRGGGWFAPDEADSPFGDPELTVPAAALLVRLGESRKDEVQGRLGKAEVVRFDSGYEAWVYRERSARDPRAAPELVLLFDPAGLLAKLRVRPAYGNGAATAG